MVCIAHHTKYNSAKIRVRNAHPTQLISYFGSNCIWWQQTF